MLVASLSLIQTPKTCYNFFDARLCLPTLKKVPPPMPLRYQYCPANRLLASFLRCSNAVKNVRFRSFCARMCASQLWCNFRKSFMQRLRVTYNFGCRALYNLPWRGSVSSHQVQCNIHTFE